jgi:hypothetical protein
MDRFDCFLASRCHGDLKETAIRRSIQKDIKTALQLAGK